MPTDHMQAAKAEATKSDARVIFRDAKFSIDNPDTWLMDFAHYADRDKITLALEVALGPDQYEQFRAMKPRPTMTETAQLIEQIVTAFNLDAGE